MDVTQPVPPTLEDLFRTLAQGDVRGKAAKALVHAFLDTHGILASASRDAALLDVFYRCLDRHLRIGVSAARLRQLLPHAAPRRDRAAQLLDELRTAGRVRTLELPVALAQTWKRAPSLPPGPAAWYASRKLDGVRCLAIATVSAGRVDDVLLLSRQGRLFSQQTSLAAALRADLARWDARPAESFVLDGELCVAAQPGADDEFVESYVHAAAQLQRHAASDDLVYFPFDVLPVRAWLGWRDAPTAPLAARHAVLASLLASARAAPATRLRALPQTRVDSSAALAALLQRAAAWEGLVLRCDVPFEGKRTPRMLKVRVHQDAEFVVEDVDVATMRLPWGGAYADRLALKSTWPPDARHPHHAPRAPRACRLGLQRGRAPVLCGASRRAARADGDGDVCVCAADADYEEAANLDGAPPSLRFPVVKWVHPREGRVL